MMNIVFFGYCFVIYLQNFTHILRFVVQLRHCEANRVNRNCPYRIAFRMCFAGFLSFFAA